MGNRYEARDASNSIKYDGHLLGRQGCPNKGDIACGPRLCCNIIQGDICWGSTVADFRCCPVTGCEPVATPLSTTSSYYRSTTTPYYSSAVTTRVYSSTTTPAYLYTSTTRYYSSTTTPYYYYTSSARYYSSITTSYRPYSSTTQYYSSTSPASFSLTSTSTESFWTPKVIGGIAGGAAGFILLVGIIIAVFVHHCRKRRYRKRCDRRAAWVSDAPLVYKPTYEGEKARNQRLAKAELLRQKYLALRSIHDRLKERKSRGSSTTGQRVLKWATKKALWYGVKHLLIYPTIHTVALATTAGFANVVVAGMQARDILDIADAGDVVDTIAGPDLTDADALNNLTDLIFPDGLDQVPDYCDLTPNDAETLSGDFNNIYATLRDLNMYGISSSTEYDSMFDYGM